MIAPTKQTLSDLLADLIAWGETVQLTVSRTSHDVIARDEQAELALSRAVEVVGEIAGRLLSLFPTRWSEDACEELRSAYRMRNRLTHGYDDVTPQRLYDIADKDVARLLTTARVWLADAEPKP